MPIILFWIAFAVLVNVIAPQLEVVGELHSAPMAPEDAPSMKAMKLMGANFKEFDSNSTVMVVIEGQQPLGPDAHQYYDEIIRKLRQDPEHIQHIQDFWGDTLTAAGAQSADGKASYVMLNLAGEQGQTLANEGVEAVRKVIEDTKAPPGVQAYVAGPAALTDDLHVIGNASLAQITLFTLMAIAGMLLVVYRSISDHADPALPDVPRTADRARSGVGARQPRRVRADDVRREHPDDAGDRGGHRLRHLHLRSLSRSARRWCRTGIRPTTPLSSPSLPSSWARA